MEARNSSDSAVRSRRQKTTRSLRDAVVYMANPLRKSRRDRVTSADHSESGGVVAPTVLPDSGTTAGSVSLTKGLGLESAGSGGQATADTAIAPLLPAAAQRRHGDDVVNGSGSGMLFV